MKEFKITKNLTVICDDERTRYGFRHVARLLRDGQELAKDKCCYYNRSWESYEFESVLERLQRGRAMQVLTAPESSIFKSKIKNAFKKADAKKANKQFGTIAAIAAMGDIMAKDQAGANDWKARMLKAGLQSSGLIMPEDWESLPEDVKTARLDAVINQLIAK